jgi:riboflavin kinase / FMN adenylyltransferase
MIIVRNLGDEIKKISGELVLSLGNFDGVHAGHRTIIEGVRAHSAGRMSAVMTFRTHPKSFLYPEHPVKILTTAREKVDLIRGIGIDLLIMIDFDSDLAAMSPGHFLNEILIKRLNVKTLVLGYDHAFGKEREGNIDTLKRIAGGRVSFVEVAPVIRDGHPVSSSRIRTLLYDGIVDEASHLLGRNYSITGTVVHGFGRGQKIGFPTANIEKDDENKIVPADGVYAVRCAFGSGVRGGVINIGKNPTFENENRTMELHVFDLDEDLYGKEVTVEFVKMIRAEETFSTVDDLVRQIKSDILAAKDILK